MTLWRGRAHRIVVAATGGDYTSISAALAAISPRPDDPYIIEQGGHHHLGAFDR